MTALVLERTRSRRYRAPRRNALALKLYELAVSLPIVAFIAVSMQHTPDEFKDPQILIWIAAIAAVDLMPVPDDDVERRVQSEFPDRTLGRPDLSAVPSPH